MKYQQTPWKADARDSKFTKVAFGATRLALPMFPKTLNTPRLKVKDQGGSLSCTAQASTLAAEHLECIPLSAEWQWMQTCKKLGTAVPNGADYRVAFGIHTKLGALAQEAAPFRFPESDYQQIGNWELWPQIPAEETEKYRKAAYIRIPRVGDHFDSMRAALLRGKEKRQIVVACTRWFYEWATKFIPSNDLYTSFAGYHCHTFIDFCIIDGREYLIGQNSYGENFGDHGLQYWPRDTVNKELSQYGCGAFVFEDLTEEQLALARQETPLGRIQRAIIEIWWVLTKTYGSLRRT